MFKKITKKMIAVVMISLLALAGSVSATTLHTSTDIDVLNVNVNHNGTWSGWQKSATVSEGDQVVFQIHAYANDGNALSLKSKLQDINNREFQNGSVTISASVDASNASKITDTVRLTFQDNGKFVYDKYKWAIKKQGSNPGSEIISPLPNGQSGLSAMTSTGTLLKDLPQDYRSNLLIYFNTEDNGSTQGTWSDWSVDHYGNYNTCTNNIKSRYVYHIRTCNGGDCDGSDKKTTIERTSCSDNNDEEGDVDTNSATSVDEDSATLNGDINNTDMRDVWFAFSEHDTTPECSSSSERIEARGGEDEGDDFYAYVRNLDEDETYYFRACGEDENYNDVEGSVRSFTTDEDDNDGDVEAKVYTNSATNIYKYSAQLNGYVNINDIEDGEVYFIYGTSSSNMDKKTSDLSINNNTTFQAITGLTPNTKYYFQAIVKDDNGIVDRGIVRSFTTQYATIGTLVNAKCGSTVNKCTSGYFTNIYDSSTQYKWKCNGINNGTSVNCAINKNVSRTAPAAKPVEVIVINENNQTTTEIKNYEERGLQINKWVSTEKFGNYTISTSAKIGDKVYYKIKVTNTSNDFVDNVEIRDFIPAELNMNGNSTDNVDKYVTYQVNLQPGQSRTILTEMILSEDARIGDIIDSAAKITINDVTEDTNSVSISVVEDNNEILSDDENRDSASIFGANSSFLPSSLFGWMGLIVLILMVGLLVTKILTINTKN